MQNQILHSDQADWRLLWTVHFLFFFSLLNVSPSLYLLYCMCKAVHEIGSKRQYLGDGPKVQSLFRNNTLFSTQASNQSSRGFQTMSGKDKVKRITSQVKKQTRRQSWTTDKEYKIKWPRKKGSLGLNTHKEWGQNKTRVKHISVIREMVAQRGRKSMDVKQESLNIKIKWGNKTSHMREE